MTRPEPIDTLTIVLPIPHPSLSPNGRPSWRTKAKKVKIHRGEAAMLCRTSSQAPRMWQKATIEYRFYWPTKAKRDDDNAVAMCKAYRDGIADAGVVVNDSAFSTLPPVMLHDKKRPRLEIVITKS